MKKNFLLVFVLLFAVSMIFASAIKAEGNTSTVEVTTSSSISTNISSSSVVEDLEGVETTAVDKVPTAFGLFWFGLKERISIALTFDPVKKAEKQVQYAEQRMKIAEKMAEKTDDPNVQEKVQKMINRSEELIAKIQEKKDTLLTNPDANVQQLLKNIAIHQGNRENFLDKIETNLQDKLTPEQLQKFEDLRQSGLGKAQGILRALENPNMPEETKAKLQEIKDKIDVKATEMAQFRGEQKQIIEDIKNGVEGAKDDLKNLLDSRKEEIKTNLEDMKTRLEDRKEIEQQLQQDSTSDDDKPQQRLNIINKVDVEEKENKEDVNDQEDQIEGRQEIKQDIKSVIDSNTKQLPERPLSVQISY